MFHFVFHPILIVPLMLIACAAGLIDTIAGGGSLITVPALLMLGLPPAFAFGTSKLQSCIGEMNATIHFIRSKKINFKKLAPGFFFVAIGSTVGTLLIQHMNNSTADNIVPWILLCVVIYTYLSPYFSAKNVTQKISYSLFFILFGLVIGFYNGFLGPGTGAFWVFLFMFFLGFDLVSASMHAKPLNMVGSFASLIFFIIGQHVIYSVGLIMAIGQLVGSRMGAHLVIHKGIIIVRPLYLVAITMMLIILFVKLFSGISSSR